MSNILLIFLGAGLGGVLRYFIHHVFYSLFNQRFPLGTLIVNVSGCFLMGILSILILNCFKQMSSELRALILIGMLGGYTTFSSFTIETINLLESGNWLSAILNIFLSVVACLFATWIGVVLARGQCQQLIV